jgi:signal transduction histidine kinase
LLCFQAHKATDANGAARPMSGQRSVDRMNKYRTERALREAHARLEERSKSLEEALRSMDPASLAALNMMEDAVEAAERLAAANADLTREVSDRKRAEEALRDLVEERGQLLRDLHDNIIQMIYAVGMRLEDCLRRTRKGSATTTALSRSIADLNSVLRDIRRYVSRTADGMIDRHCFRTELQQLGRSTEGVAGVRFHIGIEEAAVDQLAPEPAKELLAIAREAMGNSYRHSGATTGAVSLCLHNGVLRLAIEDNGVGFDQSAVRPGGNGLRNIARRAEEIGAQLEIASAPGRGTRIVVNLAPEGANGL